MGPLLWKSKTLFGVCVGWATLLKRMGRHLWLWTENISARWGHQWIVIINDHLHAAHCALKASFYIRSIFTLAEGNEAVLQCVTGKRLCAPTDAFLLITSINEALFFPARISAARDAATLVVSSTDCCSAAFRICPRNLVADILGGATSLIPSVRRATGRRNGTQGQKYQSGLHRNTVRNNPDFDLPASESKTTTLFFLQVGEKKKPSNESKKLMMN